MDARASIHGNVNLKTVPQMVSVKVLAHKRIAIVTQTATQNSFVRYNLCGHGFQYALNLGHLTRHAIMTTSVNCITFVGTLMLEHLQQTPRSACLCTVRTTLRSLAGKALIGKNQPCKI